MKKIEILGTGCEKCKHLFETTQKVADSMKIDYVIEKVSDINKIHDYGVMEIPAFVVDGKVKIEGKVPANEDIKKYLS